MSLSEMNYVCYKVQDWFRRWRVLLLELSTKADIDKETTMAASVPILFRVFFNAQILNVILSKETVNNQRIETLLS
jgi:hypothetical protein